MVNIRKVKIYVLKNVSSALFTTIKQSHQHHLTMHNNINKVKLSIVNKHINNFFAICKTLKSHCKQHHQSKIFYFVFIPLSFTFTILSQHRLSHSTTFVPHLFS